jgi:DNA-binding CsgD family transcriptional regulator
VDRPPHADARRLFEFVGEVQAAALSDRIQLTKVVLTALARLVRCEAAACTEGRVPDPLVTTSTNPEIAALRAHDELWEACLPHHPLVTYWHRSGDYRALRFSDLLSRRSLHGLPIYQYFWRPFGVEYDLGARLRLARGHVIDIALMREGRDFSAEERDLLEVLRPHVGRLLRQADNRVFANALMSCFGLTRRESEALALLVRGMSTPEIAATLFLSPGTVRKHLEHVYSKLGVTTRAAAAAAAIEACVAPPADGDDWSHGLLGMEDVLSIVGLTRRESDVLALLAAGKRNAEIGSELSLKAETVNKHLDHIYAKLGVGGRTEATVRALHFGLAGPRAPGTSSRQVSVDL